MSQTTRSFGKDASRTEAIILQYRGGLTLQQIGDRYNLSRERIRQILSRAGIKATEGGCAVRVAEARRAKETRRAAKRDAWASGMYGCTYAELIAINGDSRTKRRDCIAMAYADHKRNSAARGIPFHLSLPQWHLIWIKSGKLDLRGRGHGRYVMSRFEDRGAYEVGNVFIQLADDNVREAVKRRYARLTMAA